MLLYTGLGALSVLKIASLLPYSDEATAAAAQCMVVFVSFEMRNDCSVVETQRTASQR